MSGEGESRRAEVHAPGPAATRAWQIAPWLATLVCSALIWHPATARFGVWLLLEDHPVEWATALVALAGGLRALAGARRIARAARSRAAGVLAAALGAGLLVFAMEEISWAQRLGGYETPPALERINLQGEVNLHNIEGLEGAQKYLMIAIGIAGLALRRTRGRPDRWRLRPDAALAGFLGAMLAIMVVHVASYYLPIPELVANPVDGLVELAELHLVSAAALHVHWSARGAALEEPAAAGRP